MDSKKGTYNNPKSWYDEGKVGDVYYYQELSFYFKIKYNGNPSEKNWYFPTSAEGNKFWDFIGYYAGTMSEPKIWSEYGAVGCVYYESDYGYLRLKKEGNLEDNKWYYPGNGGSNEHWDFISWRAGTPADPKFWHDEGKEGDYYYYPEYFIHCVFKKNGKPSDHNWYFPTDGKDNSYWRNMGILNKNNWLSFIDGNLPINQISLPGTHDSATGTYSEGIGEGGMVKTQDDSVYEQLNAGIRFIDARCRHISNSFAMHHGMIYLEKMFGDILNECRRFLRENPSEFILMSVKPEHTTENCTRTFEETFKQSYYDPTLWFTEDRFPLLNEVRGKIVLFSRFGGSLGIKTHGWKDNATFDMDGRMHVQDEYDQRDEVKKWHAIRGAWNFAADRGRTDWMTLNFTSIASDFWSTTSIRDYAEDKNPELANHIFQRYEHSGIVVSDFHQIGKISSHVIMSNFGNLCNPLRFNFLIFLYL